MKKLLIAFIGVAALCGCDNSCDSVSLTQDSSAYTQINPPTRACYRPVWCKVETIRGHDYIVVCGGSADGVGIVHAAHCPCHTSFRFPTSTLR